MASDRLSGPSYNWYALGRKVGDDKWLVPSLEYLRLVALAEAYMTAEVTSADTVTLPKNPHDIWNEQIKSAGGIPE